MNTKRLLSAPPAAAIAVLTLTTGWLLFAKVEPAKVEPAKGEAGSPSRALQELWRKEKRIVDLHMHIEGTPERFDRAVKIMDRAGVGIGVNLSGGLVTHKDGEKSEFEKIKGLADTRYPGRFVHYMNLDYS